MPLIQTPTIGRRLQERYRLQRLPDGVLSPEVVPVVLVDDLSSYLEESERFCYGTNFQAAVAAELSFGAIINADENTRLRVQRVHLFSNTTQLVVLRRPTAATNEFDQTSAEKSFADFRIPGAPQAFIGGGNAAASPASTIIGRYNLIANTMLTVPLNIVLSTAQFIRRSLFVATSTVNTTLTVSWEWVEGIPAG